MRVIVAIMICIGLSILGFSLALAATQPRTESESIAALERADNAREAFAEAWNDWATKHDKFTISVEDKARFRKVRKAWKELDRLARQVEY